MGLTAMGVFAGALLVAAASPGPGIAALVARVLGRGTQGATAFVAGLIVGDLVWLAVAVLGLTAIAHAFGGIFIAIKYGGAAYLLYLAYRMWTAPVEARDIEAEQRPEAGVKLFFAGLSVTLGNPKVIAFYLALVPNLIDIAHVGFFEYLELAGLCVAILIVVLSAYVLAAARARAMFRSTRAQRLFNRTGGALMGCAAVTVAAK